MLEPSVRLLGADHDLAVRVFAFAACRDAPSLRRATWTTRRSYAVIGRTHVYALTCSTIRRSASDLLDLLSAAMAVALTSTTTG